MREIIIHHRHEEALEEQIIIIYAHYLRLSFISVHRKLCSCWLHALWYLVRVSTSVRTPNNGTHRHK